MKVYRVIICHDRQEYTFEGVVKIHYRFRRWVTGENRKGWKFRFPRRHVTLIERLP